MTTKLWSYALYDKRFLDLTRGKTNMTMYEKLYITFGLIEEACGINEDNENVILSIDKEKATIKTVQSNNFIRTNIYWKNGIEEELYN